MAYIVSPALESYATGDPDDITARWFTTSPFTTRPDGRGLTPLLSGGALLPPVEESTADIASSYGAGTVAVDPAYYGDSMWNVAPWLSGDLPALTGISIPGQDMSSWPAMDLGLQQFDPDAVPDGAAGFAAAQPFKAPPNNNFNPPAWGLRGPGAPVVGQVAVNPAGGLAVGPGGLFLVPAVNGGLAAGADGVQVVSTNGISVGASGVGAVQGSGISVDGSGIHHGSTGTGTSFSATSGTICEGCRVQVTISCDTYGHASGVTVAIVE